MNKQEPTTQISDVPVDELSKGSPENPLSPKEKKPRFGVDGAILAAAFIVLTGSLYFLLTDETDSDTAGKVPVGQFTKHANDVRRRMQDGFSWSNISKSESVYEGDSVFTGESSTADIGLKSGGHLSIDSKSLVVIHTTDHGLQLDLQYGSMTGKVNEGVPIVVSQNGVLQELSSHGAEIRISAGADKKSKIEVISGDVELKPVVKSKTAVKQTLHKNDVVHLEAPPVQKKLALEVVEPSSGRILWLADQAPVALSWKDPQESKDSSYRVELSNDSSFSTPLFSTTTTDKTYSLSEANRPASGAQPFFWHVARVAKPGVAPDTSDTTRATKLTIYPDVPPLLVSPTAAQIFKYTATDKSPALPIDLVWTDNAGSNSFNVQVAQDEEFEKVVFENKVTDAKTPKTTTTPLASGHYFWRVMGLHEQRKKPLWSQMAEFSIQEESIQLAPPVLKDLHLTYLIPFSVLKNTPASVIQSGQGVPTEKMRPLEWSPVTGAANYEVEISNREDFKNSSRIPLADVKAFAPSRVQPGSFYARVRAKSAKAESPPSNVARVDVTVPAPVIKPVAPVTEVFPDKKSYDLGHHEFKMTWTPVPFAHHYEFDKAVDEKFKKGRRYSAKKNLEEIQAVESGSTLARVRAVDKNGDPISGFSTIEVVSYIKKLAAPVAQAKPQPQPQAQPTARTPAANPMNLGIMNLGPRLRDPIAGTTLVNAEGATPFVNFRWQKFKGSNSYELQVSQDPTFSTVLDTLNVHKTSFVYSKPLPEGSVYWRVRGRNDKRISEWSNPNILQVKSAK